VNRFQTLSGYLAVMPCLKNRPDSPAELPRFKPYNGYELCKLIKQGLTRPLKASYDAIAKKEFECDLKNLIKDLEKAHEERNAKKAKMQKMIRSTLEQETGGEYRIPQKDRAANNKRNNNNKAGGGGAAGGKNKPSACGSQKECERCAKWRPDSMAKMTHTTEQCRAYNADGSRKNGFNMREDDEVRNNYRKRYNNHISNNKGNDELARKIEKLEQQAKKWEKRARRADRRKKGRGRRYYSDSDSASDMSF